MSRCLLAVITWNLLKVHYFAHLAHNCVISVGSGFFCGFHAWFNADGGKGDRLIYRLAPVFRRQVSRRAWMHGTLHYDYITWDIILWFVILIIEEVLFVESYQSVFICHSLHTLTLDHTFPIDMFSTSNNRLHIRLSTLPLSNSPPTTPNKDRPIHLQEIWYAVLLELQRSVKWNPYSIDSYGMTDPHDRSIWEDVEHIPSSLYICQSSSAIWA